LARTPPASAALAGAPLLQAVRGQPTAIATLRRALCEGRVHHAYLFEGPDGVGKELTAFGLAQSLVCERRAEGSADACGACRACVRAAPRPGELRPVHPDVVVLARGLYEPTVLGRRTPETQDLSIDQVRTLVLARAAFPPSEGRAKVFIVRRAEELSVSAANALLKTLEEPGPRTHFVLLSSVGDALLPTIRSRVQRVRFGALPEAVVVDLLAGHGVDRVRAGELARLAGGSISSALELADPEATAQREELVSHALAAVDAPNLGPALDFAEQAKKLGKDPLTTTLEALASAVAARAREAARRPDGAARPAETAATRYFHVLEAIRQLDANASAQLTVEAMMLKMRG
jgi:DNA polymerase III subunit delta'